MKKEKLLIAREKYLSAGVHIGMTSRTADMKRFIYKIRPNGLAVLNVGLLDQHIGAAAEMLAPMKNILIVSRKDSGQEAAVKFAEVVGGKAIVGRFMPGSLTNPSSDEFFEPEVMISTDPMSDKQAMKEAISMRIPIIGLADTFNETSYIDLVLPCNNKGKKSVSFVLWLVAKLIMEKRNEGSGYKFEYTPNDFGYSEN